MPDELSPRRLRRRLLQFAGVLVAVVVVVVEGPGLGGLRSRFSHASAGWVAVAVALEALSCLSYVVLFRAVFCPRMSWRLSYQIGMSEQAANSVLSVSGTGGLALGAWALHRAGMGTEFIGRRSVAFFFLTSLANVAAVALFAILYLLGILQRDPDPVLTYVFGGAAVMATVLVAALPMWLARRSDEPPAAPSSGRVARAVRFLRTSLGQGVLDAEQLLRSRSVWVLYGSIATMVFDLAVLAVGFKALGFSPPIGVIVLGYLIGQLGGNLPLPGGIGGIDGGLIGTFALYHQPLAATTAAVLIYHAISLWVPALLGTTAFIQLRNTLRRDDKPAELCMPLAEPIEIVEIPAPAG